LKKILHPPMTVEQLRELLSELPGDAIIMVPGYEGGLDTAPRVTVGEVALDVHAESYMGRHEFVDDLDEERTEPFERRLGVLIGKERFGA